MVLEESKCGWKSTAAKKPLNFRLSTRAEVFDKSGKVLLYKKDAREKLNLKFQVSNSDWRRKKLNLEVQVLRSLVSKRRTRKKPTLTVQFP